MSFEFIDPGELRDETLWLELKEKKPAVPEKGYVPAYVFSMHLDGVEESVGDINIRIGETESLELYGGHIGYGVNEDFRGQNLAARSCRLLFNLARQHGLTTLWITCDPENIPSVRTCEKAGGIFVNTIDIPEDHEMYQSGKRQVNRYRFDL